MTERLDLTKGNAYFIVLNEGEVYQAEYRGFHPETMCYWFAPLMFAAATTGPQWVFFKRVRVVFDLGVLLTSNQFERAVTGILE